MDCHTSHLRINAWIDREIAADELSELQAHLDACESCRTLAESARRQHTELRTVFQSQRAAAAQLGERVAQILALSDDHPPRRP
ncbi:MAG TPA: zf-HC2 domain-containing protein, partial [Planctomycetaceae bacterium]|nr:zf-HC2 domain-containing protein [Planctomycetaceae bacterium]